MYTRDFEPQQVERAIPETYSGNLFSEECQAPLHNEQTEKSDTHGVFSMFRSFFEKPFDFKSIPFLKKGIGTEELLIIGISAFLLFSKDGDKECAIILLLALFLS